MQDRFSELVRFNFDLLGGRGMEANEACALALKIAAGMGERDLPFSARIYLHHTHSRWCPPVSVLIRLPGLRCDAMPRLPLWGVPCLCSRAASNPREHRALHRAGPRVRLLPAGLCRADALLLQRGRAVRSVLGHRHPGACAGGSMRRSAAPHAMHHATVGIHLPVPVCCRLCARNMPCWLRLRTRAG